LPTKVRAAVTHGVNQPFRIEDVVLADPGPAEVRIRMLATGLCHSDLHCLTGDTAMQFPAVLGHEAIGEVVELGEGVEAFGIGDHVIPFLMPHCGKCVLCKSGQTNTCIEMLNRHYPAVPRFTLNGEPLSVMAGLGTFAEQMVVPVDMLAKVEKGLRADHACCIGCGVTTGLGASLIAAKVTPNSSVAVFGAGGVGLSVIQGARLAGASTIIAVDTNPAKEAVARKLGATHFVNPAQCDNVVGEVFKLTGFGADFAFECVGVPGLALQALESANPAWGLALNVGIMPDSTQLTFEPRALQGGRRWGGTAMGGARLKDVAHYAELYRTGEINLDDLVSHRLTLDEINHGFDLMRSGQSVRSVILF
jgi:S-(hydroxymethyl)glutathione dehydrogenase/alcohol dehydrogenase